MSALATIRADDDYQLHSAARACWVVTGDKAPHLVIAEMRPIRIAEPSAENLLTHRLYLLTPPPVGEAPSKANLPPGNAALAAGLELALSPGLSPRNWTPPDRPAGRRLLHDGLAALLSHFAVPPVSRRPRESRRSAPSARVTDALDR
jgi:hypothetical protein